MSDKNVNVGGVIPSVELRSYSTTPNVDGDRGYPIPDQAYIKKTLFRKKIDRAFQLSDNFEEMTFLGHW